MVNEKQNIIVQFLCFLLIQKDSKYEVMTPRIDSVLDRFRQRGPLLSSETDAGEERITEEPPVVWTSFILLFAAVVRSTCTCTFTSLELATVLEKLLNFCLPLRIFLDLGKSWLTLLIIYLADDLPDPLPIVQAKMKHYLHRRRIYLSGTYGRALFSNPVASNMLR